LLRRKKIFFIYIYDVITWEKEKKSSANHYSQQVLKLVPLRTNLMVADALTKSLPSPAHVKHRDVMIGRISSCARTLSSVTCVVGGLFTQDWGSTSTLVGPIS
jgi:hypothetical protein